MIFGGSLTFFADMTVAACHFKIMAFSLEKFITKFHRDKRKAANAFSEILPSD